MRDKEKLVQLYDELVNITNPICGRCPKPYSCCESRHCINTAKIVSDVHNIRFAYGKHHLPLMGEKTCKVPTFMRTFCSQFICDDATVSSEEQNKINLIKDQIKIIEVKLGW